MASTLGIKVANGEFYPIMEENSSVKKRLVLTTVHDNQKSAQIDLYNSFAKTMTDALYVGSLVVENIKPQPKGTPSIEMILASNAAGELLVDAVDLGSPGSGHQHLSASLASLELEPPGAEVPDFELEAPSPLEMHPPSGLYEPAAPLEIDDKQRGFPWVLVAAAAVLLVAVCGLLYFFFINDTGIAMRTGRGSAIVSPAQTGSSQTPAAPAPVPAAAPAPPAPPAVPAPSPAQAGSSQAAIPVISATEQPRAAAPEAGRTGRARTLPPVASYKVPQTIPKEGVRYTIRWGDTLWDISEAFYRNPWLYRRIAQANNIRNPSLIISGTTIRIPPRN
jgi:LysM repeat protein